MGITRNQLQFERNFVQIPNAWLRDKRLTRRARGLLAEMMTHEVGWRMTVNTLADGGPEGRDSIRSAVKELEEFGYLVREQQKVGGRFDGVDYVINDPEPPLTENPTTVKPTADKPTPAGTTLRRTSLRTPSKRTQLREEGGLPSMVNSPARDEDFTPPHQEIVGGSLQPPARPVAALRRDRCDFHQTAEYPPPCMGCKEARLAAAEADRQAHRALVEQEKQAGLAAARERIAKIKDCGMCDDKGYVGPRVCDHDPEHAERARRGAQQAREALRGSADAELHTEAAAGA